MRTLKNHLSYVVHKAQGVPKRCDYAGVVWSGCNLRM
jgi:hypothetical protein